MPEQLLDSLGPACHAFVVHLVDQVRMDATGSSLATTPDRPESVFWLGRLTSEDEVAQNRLGDRGERLDPCATGVTVRLTGPGPWTCTVRVSAAVWVKDTSEENWTKQVLTPVELGITFAQGHSEHGVAAFTANAQAAMPDAPHRGEVQVDALASENGSTECSITLVNRTPEPPAGWDPNLYECVLEVEGLTTVPFELDALPDSFRYDRRIPAYGINCGISETPQGFRTDDLPITEVGRPHYWNSERAEPDLRFATLAVEPEPASIALADAFADWHEANWGPQVLEAAARASSWSSDMLERAQQDGSDARLELDRIREGIRLLSADEVLCRSFRLMNEAMVLATIHKPFDAWRPFQLAFLLANLRSIVEPDDEASTADIIWFATGGGKTETYLGLLLTAAFHDRLTGKLSGTTAWSRFPLRMLSLQQTQRFADALAAAELVRTRHMVEGDPFSLGFLVGGGATPNRIPPEPTNPGDPDANDDTMPDGFRVLDECPFCHQATAMRFDREAWTLDHICTSDVCPWGDRGLPFRIVDDEIYRFLPTVVVGTVDKVANVSMQASMRGLVGVPRGRCDQEGHGFTYATRSSRKNGCLVPGCQGLSHPLAPEDRRRIGPSFRLQDELHLMRDSLGAVDSHYEGLLDHLSEVLGGRRPKILASSATLSGHERQVSAVYQRQSRVFPQPPPFEGAGFWTRETETVARRFVAVAPRGVTLEYALDRILTTLQHEIRQLVRDPECSRRFGVSPDLAPDIVDLYGTDVVYGNTLRDLDAVVRSTETQLPVDGEVHTSTLTGSTSFDVVRGVLNRLEQPEPDFDDRVHIVAASSMMSHGVDIDRLNVMAVYGLPLATAEFIQATARVGRRHPAAVFVLHKIARERDASVYRNFGPFVRQGDRFVEAIPVTRHSKRVLARTLPGLALGRLWQVIEPRSGRSLATSRAVCDYFAEDGFDGAEEAAALIDALGFDSTLDAGLRAEIERWIAAYVFNIQNPPPDARFPADLLPARRSPMRSLRDVEEQVPVIGLVAQ
jgi:hypothetical protein